MVEQVVLDLTFVAGHGLRGGGGHFAIFLEGGSAQDEKMDSGLKFCKNQGSTRSEKNEKRVFKLSNGRF